MKTLIIAIISIVWGSLNTHFLTNTGVSPAHAQESLLKLKKYDNDPRPIRGTIKKPNTDPISSATVRLYNSSGTTLIATVSSNSSGGYAFSPVLPGLYQVQVSATGYQDSTQFAMVINADVTLDFVLQEQ